MADANGTYKMAIDIDGYSSDSGQVTIDGERLRGGDACYEIEGRASIGGSTIDANLHIALRPNASGHPFIDHPFSMTANGLRSADAFELLGVGPLGAIVRLRASDRHVLSP